MIKKIFIKFRTAFTNIKIMLTRSQSYIAIINAGMIMFLFLDKFKEFGFDINLARWFVPIFIISMIVMTIVGYLDGVLGFFSEEQRMKSDQNPYFVKIMREVRKVNERLDEMEKKKNE